MDITTATNFVVMVLFLELQLRRRQKVAGSVNLATATDFAVMLVFLELQLTRRQKVAGSVNFAVIVFNLELQ